MAYTFDGTSDGIEATSLGAEWNVANTDALTMACWIVVDDFTSGTVFEWYGDPRLNDGFGLGVSGAVTNDLRIYTFGANSGDHASGVSTGEVFHVIAHFDQANTTIKILVNGSSIYTDTSYSDTFTITTGNAGIAIGSTPTINRIQAKMAELCFYNGSLTDGDFTALAAGCSPLLVRPDALVEYYPFVNNLNGLIHKTTLSAISSHTLPSASVHDAPLIYPYNDILQGAAPWGISAVSTDDDVPDTEDPWVIDGRGFGAR